jgi:predicted SprT family Zn-dependent metalloprotease
VTRRSGVPANGRAAARIRAELARLAAAYDEPRVRDVRVLPSGRLTASLARAYPERAEVRVAHAVLESRHLEEVLTHEVAHVVCWWRHGRTPPHGRAWAALVSLAGRTPSVRMAPSDVRLPARRRRSRHVGTSRAARVARDFLRSLLAPPGAGR